MTINANELAELLEGDVQDARIECGMVKLEYGGFEYAALEWMYDQIFFVVDSNNDDLFPGETVDVDEILDIVLQ